MLDTSARLLRLLAVLQARPDSQGADLAVRLSVTERTVRRDVRRLRDLGYPVHSAPGVGGGYRLGAGTRLPPLLLDDDEALAVIVGLRGAANHAVSGLADASVRALAKLDQVLPARLRERAAALRHATVALAGPEPAIDAALLTSLAAACRQRQRLRLRYTDHGGTASSRMVEPHRLVSAGYRWYLMAFDAGREDWRTFRVDRITGAEPAGGRFVPREAPDAAAFVAAAVTSAPYRYQGRIVVHLPAAELAGLIPPSVGVVQPVSVRRCLLLTGSDSLDSLAGHLIALGAEFRVLEPPELIERLAVLADRMRRASAGTRPSPEETAPDQE